MRDATRPTRGRRGSAKCEREEWSVREWRDSSRKKMEDSVQILEKQILLEVKRVEGRRVESKSSGVEEH